MAYKLCLINYVFCKLISPLCLSGYPNFKDLLDKLDKTNASKFFNICIRNAPFNLA